MFMVSRLGRWGSVFCWAEGRSVIQCNNYNASKQWAVFCAAPLQKTRASWAWGSSLWRALTVCSSPWNVFILLLGLEDKGNQCEHGAPAASVSQGIKSLLSDPGALHVQPAAPWNRLWTKYNLTSIQFLTDFGNKDGLLFDTSFGAEMDKGRFWAWLGDVRRFPRIL